MAWTDHKTPTIMITLSDTHKEPVRGLDLADLGVLINNHLEPMMRVAELYKEAKGDVFADANFAGFLLLLTKQFPSLAMEVISIGADEPKVKDMKLGISIQIQALMAIGKLTVEDAGGLKNLSGMLLNVLQGALQTRGPASQKLKDILSKSSISDSVKTPTS